MDSKGATATKAPQIWLHVSKQRDAASGAQSSSLHTSALHASLPKSSVEPARGLARSRRWEAVGRRRGGKSYGMEEGKMKRTGLKKKGNLEEGKWS